MGKLLVDANSLEMICNKALYKLFRKPIVGQLLFRFIPMSYRSKFLKKIRKLIAINRRVRHELGYICNHNRRLRWRGIPQI